MDSSPQSTHASTGLREHAPAGRDQALADLLHSAHQGDDRAWEQLYERFTPMLRRVARSYRLSASDIDDAVQTAWLRLFNHVGRLREPAAVAAWLVTTTRRECLRLLRAPSRVHPSDDPALGDRADRIELDDDPESVLLATERRAALDRALATLPERHRKLMTLLVDEPTMDYRTVSTTLAMPVGSIGPTRARSLVRLQRHPELLDFCPCDG